MALQEPKGMMTMTTKNKTTIRIKAGDALDIIALSIVMVWALVLFFVLGVIKFLLWAIFMVALSPLFLWDALKKLVGKLK